MNSVFLIGEILKDVKIQSKDNIEYVTDFIIKNGSNEFEIQCVKELAREVYNNTSKGDIVAIQGYLSKHKTDTDKIIIIALSVQEFRNEKTNARLANDISQIDTTNSGIFKNMNKDKISEVFKEIEKIINIVSDNKSIIEQIKEKVTIEDSKDNKKIIEDERVDAKKLI